MTLKERAEAKRLDDRLRHAWYRCKYCWWTVDVATRRGHLERCGPRQLRGVVVRDDDDMDKHYAPYDGPAQLSRPIEAKTIVDPKPVVDLPQTPEENVDQKQRDPRPNADAQQRRQWADKWIVDRMAAGDPVSSARLNAAARLAMGQGFAKATAMTMIREHREAVRAAAKAIPPDVSLPVEAIGATMQSQETVQGFVAATAESPPVNMYDFRGPQVSPAHSAPMLVGASPVLYRCPFSCGAFLQQGEEHNCEANGPAALAPIGVTATASIAAKLLQLLQGARDLGVQSITVGGLMFPVRP